MELTYISQKDMTATEALLNKGILWGEAPFTTTLIKNGRIVFEKAHLERLRKTINHLYGENPEVLSHISEAMREMAHQFKDIDYAYMRVTLFETGYGKLEFFVWALKRQVATERIVLTLDRESPDIHNPSFLKTSNYSYKFRTRKSLKAKGIDDSLFYDLEGRVLDTSIGNLFFVKGKKIICSELIAGVLDGVFRQSFLLFLENEGIDHEIRVVTKDELGDFDEIWTSNAFSGLQSVSKLDDIEYKCEYFDIIRESFNKYCGDIWPRKN
jgi:branched-subunit amino acid aminotransferase/4-amino-4-deoxychorismate lyase